MVHFANSQRSSLCHTLLGALAVVSATLTPGMAADYAPQRPIYVPQPQPLPTPAPKNWTSCFVGADMGLWVTNSRVDSDAQTSFPYPYVTTKADAAVLLTQPGPSFGLSGGCDQDNGTYVLGWQGDADFTPVPSKGVSLYTDPWSQEIRLNNHVQLGLSARVGKAFGDTLVYAKVGVGASDFRFRSRYSATNLYYLLADPTNGLYFPSSYMNTTEGDKYRWLFGPKVGLGFEHMLAPDWSVKVEAESTYYKPTRSSFTFDSVYIHNVNSVGNTNWKIPASNTWGYVAQSFVSTLKVGVNRRF